MRQCCFPASCRDYEQLARAVGGYWAQLWAEVWIVLLLIGTNIGAIIQLSEAFGYAVQTQWPDSPAWLWDRSGTAAMLFFTLCVIFPLSMLPKMRKLEMVGNGGVVILFALAVVVAVKAISNGMPALASGDFPSVSSGDLTSISETFSLLCFAFYHQVMMMPFFHEMPRASPEEAARSANNLNWASAITILGTSGLYYWFTGFFGASMYGASETSDNFLNNIWLPGVGTFIMNLTVTIYLAISIPPIFQATNHTVEGWLRTLFPRRYGGMSRPWVQRLIGNCCTILPCLGVALGVPGQSGTVLSVTGATGVAMCSYIMPVTIHFLLYFGKARCMRLARSACGSSSSSNEADAQAAATAALEEGGDVAPPVPAAEVAAGAADPDQSLKAGGYSFGAASASASADLLSGACAFGQGGPPEAGQLAPHSDAPPGLVRAYRKQRAHAVVTAGFDLLLPVLVGALGCFFSVATLVLLFQPTEEE